MSKKAKIIELDIELTDITKETPEQRAERIRYASRMQTQVIPNKKKYNRKKLKKISEND